MNPAKWTPEQVSELVRLYPTNRPEAVAAALGRSLKSVYDKAGKLGIKCLVPQPAKTPPRPAVAAKPCLPATPRDRSVRGPAYQPGEPIITAKTRYVVGPSPQQALRTNTFAE